MTLSNRFQSYAMTLPEKGPMSVPDRVEFVGAVTQEIDLRQLIENGWLEYVSGVYIDNSNNAGTLTLICKGTNQTVVFPAGYTGYIPLLLPNPPLVTVTSTANAIVTFQWYNIPVFPLLIPGPNVASDSNVNIAEVGGVAVGGADLPVIGPLTDAELRATPVDVTFAATPPAYTDYSLALAGGSETIIAAGDAENYFVIQNPLGNNPVTINLAGGNAATSGIVLEAGGSYDNQVGVSNAITASGTAADNLVVFAG